jgi:hypothetical protein
MPPLLPWKDTSGISPAGESLKSFPALSFICGRVA